MKINAKTIIIGLSILFLATVLRFWNLNSLPIFADESIYVRWSQVMRGRILLAFFAAFRWQTTAIHVGHNLF